MQTTAYSISFGTVPMFIFLPGLLRELPAASAGVHVLVAYLAIFPAAIAFWLWVYALSKADKIIYVTSVSYLTPFLAALLAFFWLGEAISAPALFGGGVIILGIALASFRSSSKKD